VKDASTEATPSVQRVSTASHDASPSVSRESCS